MSEYLPFDLETALQHPERVVTRDGLKVTTLFRLPKPTPSGEALVVQFESNAVTTNRPDGRFWRHDSACDLFLLPEPVETIDRWVNVYAGENDAYGYDSRIRADKHASDNRFACVKLTVKKGEGL